MPIRLRFAIALALIAACVARAPAAVAQSWPDPEPKQPAAPNAAAMRPMVFYVAHGEANACGPGCSEWIAAEGKIDKATADRLRELLARLKGDRPPIFFHSPGGLVTSSMLLGEVIRAQKLTVSVGHTIPLDCDRDPKSQNSCEPEIRAGDPIEATLDTATTMCNSACVYALAAGAVRLIPPWVTLGIHDIGFDSTTPALRQATPLAIEAAKAATDTRLHNYIREMGISDGLLTEAFATPFSSIRQLTRDDAARFGLDRREFGETVWQFFDKPHPTVRKAFFVRADDGERRYVNALVSVTCVPWLGSAANTVLALARQRVSSDTETFVGEPAESIRVNEQDIRLARAASPKLYLWGTRLPLKTLATASDDTSMVVPGTEFGRQQGPPGDVTLAMTGFSAAYAKLQKACAEQTEQAQSAQAASGMPQLPSVLRSSASTGTLPPLQSNPLAIGASRSAVDATLGVPTEMVGTTALYSYTSSSGENKVIAGFFDRTGHMQRFARYVLRDGKVFDEIGQTELSAGQELGPVRDLLSNPPHRIGSARPAVLPAWIQHQ